MEVISFGNFVRNRRRESDLTQEELARRVGCAAITIRKIEADDARPSVQIAERIAMSLTIPLNQRADFVRWARTIRVEPEEIPTLPPTLEEIGQEDLTGRAVRGYALLEKIGSGGMGAIYKAIQPVIEREVAVKIILPSFANHPEFIRRFEAEAQLVARLEHPHIVPLYDYWREPSVAYLVMRLLRGRSLQKLLDQGPLPVDLTSRFLEQICSALHTAHRIGIIHRDLKPANILLDEDQNTYLADFGIAMDLDSPEIGDRIEMGAFLGSPQYVSPEQIRAMTVQPQTDIYSLGVMLYEMLTGELPFRGPTPADMIQQHISAPMPPLAAHSTGLPAALDAVISRATAKASAERYETVMALANDFRRAISGMIAHPSTITQDEFIVGELTNPYKGLRAFGEADAEDFFGRETLIQQLLARLSEGGELTRFLAVVGPSGSGKSSVVNAGLVPALRRGGLPGSEKWFFVDFLPGTHPFEELESALLRVAVNPPAGLLDQLKSGSHGLSRIINHILPSDQSVELVLVIDQFEELFTLAESETERALFLNSLLAASLDESSRVRIVITLRADFIDRPLRYVDFGELLQSRNELVLPLTPDELERAIVAPARRAGLKLEAGLVSTIVRDLGEQSGNLPLLQFALTDLFEQREGNVVTKAAYQVIGGVRGALGSRIEQVYARLNAEEQAMARQMFLRLVTLGEGTGDTRRRVLRIELENLIVSTKLSTVGSPAQGLSAIIEAFGRSRLLSFDHDPITRTATVEVAHEALIGEWARLRAWLSENRDDVRLQRQLATAASEWQSAGCDASYLLIGTRLTQFAGWASSTSVALTQQEQSFLELSIQEQVRIETEDAARQRRELETAKKLAETERLSAQRLRGRHRIITAVGITAIMLAVLAVFFAINSNLYAQQAQANFIHAEAQRLATEGINALNANASAEVVALLSIRSIKLQYSPQGDAALLSAIQLNYPERMFSKDEPLFVVNLSPDSSTMLVGSTEGHTAWLVDFQTGDELQQLVHPDAVLSAVFSPDSRYVLTNGTDNVQRVWEVKTGQEVQHFLAEDQIRFGGFSADGEGIYIGTIGEKYILHRWNVITGQEERFWQLPSRIRDVSPDGRLVITFTAGEPAPQIWDLESGQPIHTLSTSAESTDIQFCADGKQAVIGYFDGTARVWDTQSGTITQTLQGHNNTVRSVDCTPDGQQVLTGSDDRTALLWDAPTGTELQRFRDQTIVSAVVLAADGQHVITLSGDGEGNTARIWTTQPKYERPIFTGHQGIISGVAFSPEGQLLATADSAGEIRLWDVLSGQEIRKINSEDTVNYALQFSPDGRYLASGQWHTGIVQLWDVQTGKEVRHFSADNVGGINEVAFSPDGRYLFGGGGVWIDQSDANAFQWDVQTGDIVFAIPLTESGEFYGTDYSPDGNYLVTAHSDGTARLWDARTGQLVRKFSGHPETLASGVFSPDGKMVLTTGFKGAARLWDVQSGVEIRQFIGHTDMISHAAFSTDGLLAATAGFDGTVRLWEVSTGREIRRFTGHKSGVENVAFSPDGKFLVSVGDDSTVRMWDIDYHATIQYLCTRLQRDFTEPERQEYGITDPSPTCP